MLRTKTWSLALGGTFAITYVICILWHLAVDDPAGVQMLQSMFPGLAWLTPLGFLIGLVESFVYGAYGAAVFVFLHNRLIGNRTVEHVPGKSTC